MEKKKKHAGGRPPKYSKVGDMQKIIDAYFDSCVSEKQPPTVTGLAMALDMSREGLVNYAKKDEFFDAINKAKGKIEAFLEKRLFGHNVAGVIFNLKNNYRWKDTQSIDAPNLMDNFAAIVRAVREKENGSEK